MDKNKFKNLLKKAENGDADAMYLVGLAYEAGNFVEADINEAIAWMKDSADLGNNDAKAWLEDYYFDDNACTQAYS